MKTFYLKILTLCILFVSFTSYTQTNKYITIENVPEDVVWPIVYQTFKDLKLKYPHINKQLGEGETVFFQYSTMLAKNRAKYKMVYANNNLTISLFERQYLSQSNWVDNPLPISKKQSQKLLKPIKEHIQKLLADKNFTSKYSSNKNKISNSTKPSKGIFNNYAIAKTKNENIQLLSFHENGNLLGIGLSEDKSKVQSLVFQENEESDKTTMLFDENGYPKSIITANHILNITKSNNIEAIISIFKTDGTFIKSDKLSINDFETFNTSLKIENNANGPSIFHLNHASNTENLATALSYASTAISAVTCAASLTTLIGAIPACGSLLLDVIQKMSNEDAFYYDELALINNVIGVIPFKNPLKNYEAASKLMETFGNLVDGMSYVLEGSQGIYNKIFPEGKLTITGADSITTGAFGKPSDHSTSYFVKSNYPGKIEFRSIFIKDMDIEEVDLKQNEIFKDIKENIAQFNVYANTTGIMEHYLEASQIIDGERVTVKKEIKIIEPNYYSFPDPDCQELFNKKIIDKSELDKCLDNEKKCKKELWDSDDYFVSKDLSKTSDFSKSNFYLKLKKEDGTKYPSSEYGEFRDFVKIAPCMVNWSGIDDKRQIIILVNEALLKIEAKETKIKELQKVANATNYQKIATDIKNIENTIEPIKIACVEKVKKIAKKRTIQFKTDKSADAKNQYYAITGAEVMGFKWGKYGGPSVEMEIFFTPKRTVKTVKQFSRTLKFHQDLKRFSFSFEDGSEKPLKYALLINDKIRQEGKVKTTLRIKDFEKDIKLLNFYDSSSKDTKIE